MRHFTITELTNKVVEHPDGTFIDGVLFHGVRLDALMGLVSKMDDTTLDAVNAFCRRLTMKQQQEALASWEE